MENPSDYRVGSPFAEEPETPSGDNQTPSNRASQPGSPVPAPPAGDPAGTAHQGHAGVIPPESAGGGVWEQTAASAAYSAVMLLVFAAACWLIFPAGGVAVAALGALVSLAGLVSAHYRLASLTLGLHGLLFFACYARAI